MTEGKCWACRRNTVFDVTMAAQLKTLPEEQRPVEFQCPVHGTWYLRVHGPDAEAPATEDTCRSHMQQKPCDKCRRRRERKTLTRAIALANAATARPEMAHA